MITILCSGSRGDIQPYIALAQGLQRQGEPVQIVAGSSFTAFITAYGIAIKPLSLDMETIDIDPKMLEAARTSDNPLKMLLTFNKMKKYAAFMAEEMFDACAGSELIIYHPGCTIGYFAAQYMDIKAVCATPFPLHKTKGFASVIAYGRYKMLPIGLSYTLVQKMLWMASKTGVDLVLKQKFPGKSAKLKAPYQNLNSRHHAVVSCSNFVFNRPADWSAEIYQGGYWFVAENEVYEPPESVVKFLNNGVKPIYFGFGSVFQSDQQAALLEIIITAMERTNNRAIIGGMDITTTLPKTMLAIANIEHTWLFKHVKAVCHHGGAGTTAAGFSAGVPSIIVPFSNDQFAWAHRAFEIGVAAQPIYRKNLSVATLISAIVEINNPIIAENAKKLAENMATEQGATGAARVIIEMLSRT
ncbi:MAG: glycosyltransferase [Culicoidibacterales bacterium]